LTGYAVRGLCGPDCDNLLPEGQYLFEEVFVDGTVFDKGSEVVWNQLLIDDIEDFGSNKSQLLAPSLSPR